MKILINKKQSMLLEDTNKFTKTVEELIMSTLESKDKENICGINLQKFLLRMFPATLRRHRRDSTLHDLEEGLLDTFAGNVPCT